MYSRLFLLTALLASGAAAADPAAAPAKSQQAAAVSALPDSDAPAPPSLCGSFVHNADGSWTAKNAIDVAGPDGEVASVNPRSVFFPGITYSEVDVAAVLDKSCGK